MSDLPFDPPADAALGEYAGPPEPPEVPRIVVADPPRAVPGRLRLLLTWGHPIAACGWLFGGFGLIFVTVFGLMVDWSQWTENWRAAQHVRGQVERARETSANENRQPIWQIDYTYRTPDGQTRHGFSFELGSPPEAGESVDVEYLPDRPDVSRIAGGRRAPFAPWLVPLLCIFPLVGLGLIVGAVLYGRGRVRLLRDGQAAWGLFQSAAATNTRVNNRTVYKVTFAYQDQAAQGQVGEFRSLAPERFSGEVPVLLLCDPLRPKRVLAVEDLGVGVSFSDRGELTASISPARYLLLLPMLLTLVGHGGYWLVRLAG
jgi:hypothetical protein